MLATSTIIEIQHSINKLEIGQGYFSSIISVQTAIFSLIVAVILTLYFFFNWKVSKEQIKNESDIRFNELKKQMEEELEIKTAKLEVKFAEEISRHENDITTLNGSVFRTLGEFWDSEKDHDVAFIWWLRAANKFSLSGEDKFTRISLQHAKDSVERVGYAYQLNSEWVGEYQKLILEISDEYKIEKELLDIAIKETLKRKAPTNS